MNQKQAASNVSVGDIEVTKLCDLASVKLVRYCTLGTHIDNGTITCRKNAGLDHQGNIQKHEYFVINLKGVMVNKVEWTGSDPTLGIPEKVTLSFEQFEVNYQLQDNKGVLGDADHFAFDIANHEQVASPLLRAR